MDAGPLIGLFYSKDTFHQECVEGFTQIKRKDITAQIPLPIAFEVYKWLLHRTHPALAQKALRTMNRSFYVLPFQNKTFVDIQDMVYRLPEWRGSLEDATVMLSALQYRCPIWTYNFRDFTIFKSLEFWNPGE